MIDATPNAGFREMEHTADWAMEVWAPTWPQLLAEAARGMYALMRVHWAPGPRQQHPFALDAPDRETLLVDFLSEVLFVLETRRVAFDAFHLDATAIRVRGHGEGRPAAGVEKEIKAVTYHDLRVEATPQGWRATVTFDV